MIIKPKNPIKDTFCRDGITLRECPKLRERSVEEIALFLIENYNQKKIQTDVSFFKKNGFTARSLQTDVNNLFRFLVLVSYDRRPFTSSREFSKYENIWNKQDPSFTTLHAILEQKQILNREWVKLRDQPQIQAALAKIRINNSRLDTSARKSTEWGTNFAKTILQLAQRSDEILRDLKSVKESPDIVKLHQNMCKIHGFGEVISAKFLMYTLREMQIGNIIPSEFQPIAKYIRKEYHNEQ